MRKSLSIKEGLLNLHKLFSEEQKVCLSVHLSFICPFVGHVETESSSSQSTNGIFKKLYYKIKNTTFLVDSSTQAKDKKNK